MSTFCTTGKLTIKFLCVKTIKLIELAAQVHNFPCTKYQYSRVDTDVLMEVAYSCNFLAVSDSSTCPDIGTS